MGILSLLQAGVWRSIGGVVLAVAILLVMITVHEFGHYIVGRILGFKINEFSIGFGPALFKKRSKKNGQLFALRVIPLGGYCAFDGEDEFEEPQEKNEQPFDELQKEGGMDEVNNEAMDEPAEKADEYPQPQGARFNDQAPWKRILVLLAGVTMNYILALVLLIIMVGAYGKPMCIVMPIGYNQEMSVPHETWETPILSQRDVLLEINGKKISMVTDCMDALKGKKAGDEVTVTVLRYQENQWKEKDVTLVLHADANFKNMGDVQTLTTVMGLEIYMTTMQRGFWHTIGGALDYSLEMGTAVLRSLGELLTGKLGLDAVGGPVTTITTTAQAASTSPFSFLYIAAFIGVNLAVFNLLPVPALDGCKIIFCLIEWIRKKPVNRKVEAIINIVGLFFLLGFAILIDVLQFF